MIDQRDDNPTRRRPGPPTDAIMGMADALIRKLDDAGVSVASTRGGGEHELLRVPERLGRLEVGGKLGAGAMGVVYAARDPMLGRDVAIKVLSRHTSSEISVARARREAQAMAQLSHPNVVKVFAIGDHDGALYIAMERIYGRTLAQWQSEQPPEAILGAYRQAGQGLAALHAHGLLHRDFKPANAMMGDDGRVRVLDLGLVREVGTASASSEELSDGSGGPRLSHGSTTVSDAIMGTPAYMSPEQFLGGNVGPAADQFSFCVSLYEGLYGHRPFKAKTMTQLVEAIASQRVEPPPPDAGVPRHVYRALRRGLSSEPGRRHASMESLLDALDTRRRYRLWAGGLAVAGVLAAAPLKSSVRPTPCPVSERWSSIWTVERDGATGSGEPLAVLRDEVLAVELKVAEVCERGPTPSDVECFDALFGRYESMIEIVEAPPQGVSLEALTNAFIPPSICDEAPNFLGREAEYVQLEADGSRVDALALAGEYEAALELGDDLVRRAQAFGQPTVLYDAFYQRGKVYARTHMLPEAEADFEAAYEATLIARAHQATVNTASSLVWVTQNKGDLDAAEHWLNVSASAYEALNGAPPSSPRHLTREGELRLMQGRFDEAQGLLERAAQGWRALDDAREVATVLGVLTEVYVRNANTDAALAAAKQAISVMTEAHGDEEPQLGTHYLNLGSVLQVRGDDEASLEAYAQAVSRRAKAYGSDHLSTGIAECSKASALLELGRGPEAKGLVESALPKLPEGTREAASCLLTLAKTQTVPTAVTTANRAVVILEGELGHRHPDVVQARADLSEIKRAAENGT